jgi:hypothetical protein
MVTLRETRNKNVSAILDGFICMSCFTKVNKLSDDAKKNLSGGVLFNAALSTPNNFSGLDMVIPVVLKNGQLGSINIQAKSYAGKLSDKVAAECVPKLYSAYVCSPGIPRLNVLINITPARTVDIVKIVQHGEDVVLHIEGLHSRAFPFINEEYDGLKELLQIILEFGRLERALGGRRLTGVPETRNIDEVFAFLRENKRSGEGASDSSATASSTASLEPKRRRIE